MTVSPFRFPLASVAAVLLAAGLASCGAGHTERQTGYARVGIDVSHHQEAIDWSAVAADGVDFAFVKATEGVDHADTRFCGNWADAKTAGLVRGAYHFFRADRDGRAQADHFHRAVELRPGDLPAVVDVETLDGATPEQLIANLRTWLFLTEIRTGAKPLIYTNLKFYYRHLAGHFDGYPLWIARYSSHAPALSPATAPAFWQYGNRGRVAGIAGDVDLDVFLGDAAAFEALRLREPSAVSFRP